MQKRQHLVKGSILMFWTMALTMLTGLFGAIPMKAFRHITGSLRFAAIILGVCGVFVAFGWSALAILLLGQALVVGIYSELEARDFRLRQSSGFAVVLSALFMSSIFYFWALFTGKTWFSKLAEGMELVLARATEMNLPVVADLKALDLIYQIPSAVVILLIISLYFSLVFEKAICRWGHLRFERKEHLADFVVPDFLIWPLIACLLGAFGNHEMKALQLVSVNILNVLAVTYFFQGLAVIFKYFEVFRVARIWRVLWVLLLVVQLPIVTGIIGVADYWVNFRKSFAKKAAEIKKSRLQG